MKVDIKKGAKLVRLRTTSELHPRHCVAGGRREATRYGSASFSLKAVMTHRPFCLEMVMVTGLA